MDSSYVGISGYSSPFFDLSHGNMVSWRQNSGAVKARVPWHSFQRLAATTTILARRDGRHGLHDADPQANPLE